MGVTSAIGGGEELGPRSVVICGGGNGGHALAVVVSQSVEGTVDWLVGSHEKATLLTDNVTRTGLRSTGVLTAAADRLRTITADPAAVIPNADLILIVVPAFCHGGVLERIAPYVPRTAAVGCLPTRGGFEFDARRLRTEDEGPTIFGLQTLPWSTRVTSPGETVNFGAAKATVVLASLPTRAAAPLARMMATLLGTDVVAVDSILNLTLGNPGQFIHPGLMYGHFHAWDGQEYTAAATPKFYAEATEEMGEVVASLSAEAAAVAREVERRSDSELDLHGVVPVIEWLRDSYSHVTEDTTTVATCFRTGPIQARLAPMTETRPGVYVPDFAYRYLAEDVPYGLVVTRAIAELAEVRTPTIDKVISWAQSVMNREWLVGGRLRGRDVTQLPIPQNHGIRGLDDLIAWYRGGASFVRDEPLVLD
jgi:predicted dinucleotide-binding enzyme